MDEQMPQNMPKKGNPMMWIILIVVVLIAVAAILYFGDFFNTNTNSNTNTVANTNTGTNTNVATNTNTTVNQNTNTVSNTNSETNTNNSTNTNSSVDTSDWKTYSNINYSFSFQYPGNWTLEEKSSNENDSGKIVSLQSPETLEMLNNGTIDPAYAENIVVSFWPSINTESARGGSWVGQREYSSLADYLTDSGAPKTKVGEITIDGLPAYEVSIGGAGLAYGVMIEKNGIYEIAFLTAWDKSQLGTTEQEILSTFVFTN